MREVRTENFIMRVSPTEMAMLKAVAEATGLSAADVVRTAIRREYAKVARSEPVPLPKTRRPAKGAR